MGITSTIEERLFTVRNGIAANLLVVLLGALLLVTSVISVEAAILIISAGCIGVILNSAFSPRRC